MNAGAQQQGQADADQQHPAALPGRHRGPADQQHEHEQVVQGQAVLGQPAGEELAGRPRPGGSGDGHAEQRAERDDARRAQRRLGQPGFPATPGADDQVGHGHRERRRREPPPTATSGRAGCGSARSRRRSAELTSRARRCAERRAPSWAARVKSAGVSTPASSPSGPRTRTCPAVYRAAGTAGRTFSRARSPVSGSSRRGEDQVVHGGGDLGQPGHRAAAARHRAAAGSG